jgi:hypothetical protein
MSPILEKILKRRQIVGECWEWTGAWTNMGYGAIWIEDEQRQVYVHRRAYEIYVGPIPAHLVLDHLCANPPCFNPKHLRAVTQGENVRAQPRIAFRTSCRAGHPLTGTNVYITPRDGLVKCRECRRVACVQYEAKRTARRHANT